MTADLHTFPGRPLDLRPVDAVVEELERLLEEAKGGYVRAIAVAVVRPPGDVGAVLWVNGEHMHDLGRIIGSLHHDHYAERLQASKPQEG
jgi:hypothetical protein